MKKIYFDYNASTPIEPQVADAMADYARNESAFGNPSLIHWAGTGAKQRLELAGKQVADFMNASPEEVFFTSGGTESNNHVIKGVVQNAIASNNPKPHIITSSIEHPSVLRTCDAASEDWSADITTVAVDDEGRVDIDEIEKAIKPNTSLISIMHANNEFGTIQPIRQIGALARQYNIPFHVDAVCSAGKKDIDVQALNADLLSISGHKIYAPKGIGALYINENIKSKINPLIHGAGQQAGQRSGTDNVMLAIGLGEACRISKARDTEVYRNELHELTGYFLEQLKKAMPERIEFNGCLSRNERLCNTLNVSFLGSNGYELLQKLGVEIAFTAGLACSYSVSMLGKNTECADGSVRFSLGKYNNQSEVDYTVAQFAQACQ